jgi:hypothetical protein
MRHDERPSCAMAIIQAVGRAGILAPRILDS